MLSSITQKIIVGFSRANEKGKVWIIKVSIEKNGEASHFLADSWRDSRIWTIRIIILYWWRNLSLTSINRRIILTEAPIKRDMF